MAALTSIRPGSLFDSPSHSSGTSSNHIVTTISQRQVRTRVDVIKELELPALFAETIKKKQTTIFEFLEYSDTVNWSVTSKGCFKLALPIWTQLKARNSIDILDWPKPSEAYTSYFNKWLDEEAFSDKLKDMRDCLSSHVFLLYLSGHKTASFFNKSIESIIQRVPDPKDRPFLWNYFSFLMKKELGQQERVDDCILSMRKSTYKSERLIYIYYMAIQCKNLDLFGGVKRAIKELGITQAFHLLEARDRLDNREDFDDEIESGAIWKDPEDKYTCIQLAIRASDLKDFRPLDAVFYNDTSGDFAAIIAEEDNEPELHHTCKQRWPRIVECPPFIYYLGVRKKIGLMKSEATLTEPEKIQKLTEIETLFNKAWASKEYREQILPGNLLHYIEFNMQLRKYKEACNLIEHVKFTSLNTRYAYVDNEIDTWKNELVKQAVIAYFYLKEKYKKENQTLYRIELETGDRYATQMLCKVKSDYEDGLGDGLEFDDPARHREYLNSVSDWTRSLKDIDEEGFLDVNSLLKALNIKVEFGDLRNEAVRFIVEKVLALKVNPSSPQFISAECFFDIARVKYYNDTLRDVERYQSAERYFDEGILRAVKSSYKAPIEVLIERVYTKLKLEKKSDAMTGFFYILTVYPDSKDERLADLKTLFH